MAPFLFDLIWSACDSVGEAVRMNRLTFLFAAILLLSTCQAKPSLVKPRVDGEGAVSVYLLPFPQEAEGFRFRVEAIFAVRQDGEAFPLSVPLKELVGKEMKRERLLANGDLPPGQYTGFSFRVKDSTLKGEEGDIALVPAEGAPNVPVSFVVHTGRTAILSLQFRYGKSVGEGFRFIPSFSAAVPGKIASGLVGLVTDRRSNTATMFDKVSGRVVGVIPTGTSPAGMAMDPVSRKAYVAITGEDSVEVIDLLEMAVIRRERLTAGDNPLEVALTPDGKTLLTANSGSNTVSIIDASSMVETKRLQVGVGPQSVLIDRAGRRAYVFNTLSNTISVVDIAARAVAATVATESGPVRGQFNRAGNRLYVLHRHTPYLIVLDPLSFSVVRRVNIGAGGTAMKVDSRTDMIYVAKRYGEEVDVYDPFSFLPMDSIRTGGETSFLAIDGEANSLLILLPGRKRLRIVHLVGKGTAAEIDVGEDPCWVTIMGER
jgi:YVTN family beta-propeller protein